MIVGIGTAAFAVKILHQHLLLLLILLRYGAPIRRLDDLHLVVLHLHHGGRRPAAAAAGMEKIGERRRLRRWFVVQVRSDATAAISAS